MPPRQSASAGQGRSAVVTVRAADVVRKRPGAASGQFGDASGEFLPRGQSLHETEFSPPANIPMAHAAQSDAAAALMGPISQLKQAVAPLSGMNNPGSQIRQVVDPVASAKWPLAHAMQIRWSDAPWDCPAEQLVQLVEPEFIAY